MIQLFIGLVLGLLTGLAFGWLLAARKADQRVHEARVRAERAEAVMTTARPQESDHFAAIAAEVLDASSDRLLTLAEQRFAAGQHVASAELSAREQTFRQLLEPLASTLDKVRTELVTTEQARAEGQALLDAQLRGMREDAARLRGETAQLVTALRSAQVRGRWGEIQLRRVVEAAGMMSRVDFVEQNHTRTDDGAQRPDLVVKLAGGKQVVVDAKVPFLGFLDAVQATGTDARSQGLAAHARQVRAHVDSLADKRYWEQFTPSPEFVVMFVPVESFLPAALEADPTIVEYAFERHVVVATPTTLLALLRTVAYAWRQDALADNAQAVLDLGRQLHGRLATMGSHVAKLGRALESANVAYNQTVASLETRVLVSARRFMALGVVDGDLDQPEPIDPHVAGLSAAELVASSNGSVLDIDDRPTRSG